VNAAVVVNAVIVLRLYPLVVQQPLPVDKPLPHSAWLCKIKFLVLDELPFAVDVRLLKIPFELVECRTIFEVMVSSSSKQSEEIMLSLDNAVVHSLHTIRGKRAVRVSPNQMPVSEIVVEGRVGLVPLIAYFNEEFHSSSNFTPRALANLTAFFSFAGPPCFHL